jgi:hypothetical protein
VDPRTHQARISEGFFTQGSALSLGRQGEVRRNEPDQIERTVTFWEGRTRKEYSREDAREMLANISGFFDVLAEWDLKGSEEEQTRSKVQEESR